MFKLSEQKKQLLKEHGNLIVLGGPGSGKTTIALVKAEQDISNAILKPGQKILFLSFARSTIARVEQQISTLKFNQEVRNYLETNTYHGFFWKILKSNAYLLTKLAPTKLLPPPEAASLLAEFEGKDARKEEKNRLFYEEGLLHFDLFAPLCAELLKRSKGISGILSDSYPIVILDEFQDTNSSEWEFIQEIGKRSTLIALADAEQRIYEFRGADPARIGEFIKVFEPKEYDFGNENNRSNGTDILKFGNDLLKDAVRNHNYSDVEIIRYPFRRGIVSIYDLKLKLLSRIQKLRKAESDWSIAVLVPTKVLMLSVSKYLSNKQSFTNGSKLPALPHEVALETAGPSLSAILISGLLEQNDVQLVTTNRLINDLCSHIKGRRGDKAAPKQEIEYADALIAYTESGKIRGTNRKNTIEECIRIASESSKLILSGDPANDWVSVRKLLFGSTSKYLKQVAEDALYLRLLNKGSILRTGLSELWRTNSNYSGASSLVQNALVQEHFNNSVKELKGIQIMTMHKAKGKEFDEVIIYEELHRRIVRQKSNDRQIEQARLNLRVAVTRAMKHTTILTPNLEPCRFL